MQISKLFSVYDSKAEAFIQPFFSPTTGTAIRSFESACNEASHDFNKHAGDYTLFEIGEFDHDSAKLETLDTPHNLGIALTFISQEPA